MLKKFATHFASLFESPRAPKKKLYVHAGLFKTGTSYFQHVLYHNREQLKQAGMLYPKTGLGLNTSHNKYAHRWLGIHLNQGIKNHFPTIIEALNADNKLSQALVSYEGFCLYPTLVKLQAERAHFKPIELHSILVFRPHLDYALSLYRELSQHVALKCSFKEFIDPQSGFGRLWKRSLNYREIVQEWRKLAGKNNVHSLSYRAVQHDIIGNIMAVTGHHSPLTLPENVVRNPTLSAPSAAVMRRINHEKFNEKIRGQFSKVLLEIDAQHPHFHHYCEISHAEALRLEHQHAADRRFLEKQAQISAQDLMIGDAWRWGDKTDFAPAQKQAQDALIQRLQDQKSTALLAITERTLL